MLCSKLAPMYMHLELWTGGMHPVMPVTMSLLREANVWEARDCSLGSGTQKVWLATSRVLDSAML